MNKLENVLDRIFLREEYILDEDLLFILQLRSKICYLIDLVGEEHFNKYDLHNIDNLYNLTPFSIDKYITERINKILNNK